MFLLSLPMRERGLKSVFLQAICQEIPVAPHAGAWIEIWADDPRRRVSVRRSPCGSVD